VNILCLETATEGCSAALSVNGQLHSRESEQPQGHSELILPMTETVLDEAGLKITDLDAIAFDRGPGSFTGIRIGTGVTQGLAFAADLPVIPVSSLAILAQAVFTAHPQIQTALCAIDARMNEVYWGVYQRDEHNLPSLVGEEIVCQAGDTPKLSSYQHCLATGSGWGAYPALGEHHGISVEPEQARALPLARHMEPLARHALQQGQTVAADNAIPVYLRDDVAKKKGEQ